MKLVLFYLTNDSRHYTFPHFVNLLNSSKKKDEWTLLVLTHSNDIEFYSEEINKYSFSSKIVNIPENDNYMNKVRYAINFAEENNSKYMMKCDNDIFLTSKVLDYMIDNLSILDGNSEFLTLGPSLSSGIPGVEYFMNQFLSDTEQSTLKEYFLKTNFYDRDDVNYNILNVHTLDSKEWYKERFFNTVKAIPHHYKGIHPIRINYEAIDYLNTCILKNKEKFFSTEPSSLILNDNSPYLCNSVFCIRTDIYKTIIYDSSLFVDPFDEVPLNIYAWQKYMKHCFVKNGLAIHILYNWYNNYQEYEENFVKDLFS